jgi:hypothetical protein
MGATSAGGVAPSATSGARESVGGSSVAGTSVAGASVAGASVATSLGDAASGGASADHATPPPDHIAVASAKPAASAEI